MGKGKGNFKRWCTIIYPGRVFIEHRNVTPKAYTQYVHKLKLKLKLKLKFIHHTNVQIKTPFINTGLFKTTDVFAYFKIKKYIYKPQKCFYKLITTTQSETN